MSESIINCLDLNKTSSAGDTTTPAPNGYETVYVTSHKAPCRAGAFSADGKLIATGSADTSIKILDVEKMISKRISNQQQQNADSNSNNLDQDENNPSEFTGNNEPGTNNKQQNNNQNSHPVLRTLYDHCEEVTCLQFHPLVSILASCSQDKTIKFYDYARTNARRAHKTIQEASPVRCLTFHPCGGYMLVGCQQPTLRLYDINTIQSFVSSNPLDQHSGPIVMIDYNKNGSFYVSGCELGDIKIWDGTSNRCVNTFRGAHDGPISSVKVSRNGKYILTVGKDCLVRLWDMCMANCLMTYDGALPSIKNQCAQAVFNHTEEFVLLPDARSTNLHWWDSQNGHHHDSVPLGHNNSVSFITHSQTNSSMLTCSEDFRARFWSAPSCLKTLD